jgi:hypothetical protein
MMADWLFFFFLICAVGFWVLRSLLAYCTSPGWYRWWWLWRNWWNEDCAGETEVHGENLPQRHFVHHKSHMTRPGFWIRAAAVGSRRLTAWAVARPGLTLHYRIWIKSVWSFRCERAANSCMHTERQTDTQRYIDRQTDGV